MKRKIQVLLPVMNLKNEQEFLEKIKHNKITTGVVCINQVSNEKQIFNYENKNIELYSYNEKGASKSRNKLLRKASGDICILSDDDMIYEDNYEQVIEEAFNKNDKADIIIFNIQNANKSREKIKNIKNKKLNKLDIMRVRTPQIVFKNKSVQKYKVEFDEIFGPGAKFHKGEETVFIADCMNAGMNIISVDKDIGHVLDNKSTWFKGFNKEFLYDQGAIFARIYPKLYYIIIIQYIIRKYNLYKKNLNIFEAYKMMLRGAKEYQKHIGEKYDGK